MLIIIPLDLTILKQQQNALDDLGRNLSHLSSLVESFSEPFARDPGRRNASAAI